MKDSQFTCQICGEIHEDYEIVIIIKETGEALECGAFDPMRHEEICIHCYEGPNR